MALSISLGIGSAVRADTVDLATAGDTTVSGASSTVYTNSGDETRSLSFKVNSSYTYSGMVSGKTAVRVYTTGSVRKTFGVSATGSSHTGGTTVNGQNLKFSISSTFGFGTGPIAIAVNDTDLSGQVILGNGDGNLTNDLVIVGTVDSGRQTVNAAIRDAVSKNTAAGTTFSGSVDATGCAGFSIAQNHEYRTATRAMNFTGPVNAAGANVYLTIVTNSCIYFKNSLTADRLDCSYYTKACRRGTVSLAAGKSYDIGDFSLACHNVTVGGTLSERCILSWVYPGSAGLARQEDLSPALQLCPLNGEAVETGMPVGVFTLAADQTINCLTGVVVSAGQAALPGMALTGADKTVTLKCALAQADCYARIDGSLSLILNATSASNRQSFFARTNGTMGAISVQKGVFEIGEGASFPNVSGVTVGSSGTLQVRSSVEGALPSAIDLNLAGGATVAVGDGVTLAVNRVFVDGVQKAKAQLAACGVTVTGNLTVADEPMVQTDGTWTAAQSGNWTAATNWRDGTVPTGNASTATLAAVGEERDDPIVITTDVAVTLGAIVADGSVYRLAGSSALTLGNASAGGALGADGTNGVLEVKNALVSAGPYVSVNERIADPDGAGRIVWEPLSFGAGAQGAAAVFTTAGVTEFPTAASLAFATDAAGLLLGRGTVRYVGEGDATIGGFTIYDTGMGAGIIDVTNEQATLTVAGAVTTDGESTVNALCKYGAGRLTLLGDATIGGTAGQVGAELNLADDTTVPRGFGAAANGTGPTNGVASLNVVGGTLQIGDDTHAPTVETSHGLIIGARAYRADAALGGQEGHFVLSNGTVTVRSGTATLGYYGPAKRDDGTYPTVCYTQEGGSFTVNDDFRVGFSYNSGYQQSNQRFTLNGGTFSCTKFEVGYANGARGKVSAGVTVNGGLLSVSGDFTSQDRNNGTRALFVGNGGRMEAGRVRGYCGAAYKSGSYPSSFTFNSGFTLKTATFIGRGNTTYPQYNYCNVFFDGGTWEQPLAAATFGDFCSSDKVEAKAGGFHVALTNDAAKTYSLTLDAAVSGAGGIFFRGSGFATFGNAFTNSTCAGGVTVTDGATVLAGVDSLKNLSVTLAPTGALRVVSGAAAKVKTLTLGVAGATDAACLQMTEGSSLVVSGDFKVVSPIVFKRASSDAPNAELSGQTDLSGFTIDCKTISAYDRTLLGLAAEDVAAGYGLRVYRSQTETGHRLTFSIGKKLWLLFIVR